MARHPLSGHPLLLCMGATFEGLRNVLEVVESSVQYPPSVRGLSQDLLDRGLSPDRGLLCITPGAARLSWILTECFGSQIRLQHCQMHKLARAVSYLAAAEQRPIQGAISRAFALPDLALARAVLLQIHTQLRSLSCSAALWLLQDLDRPLTFHQSGVYDRLSDSLRGTQLAVLAVQQLNRRVRGNWLPPTSRRALFALLLPEMEVSMH